MIQLTNGCTCTEFNVYPKNWKSKEASTEKDWYIYYRFHDPLFLDSYPDGKPVQVKKGFNYLKDLKERQEAVEIVLKATKSKVKDLRYNPITNQFMPAGEELEYVIHPETSFIDAMMKAYEIKKKDLEPHTIEDYDSMFRYFNKAIRTLYFDTLPIKDVTRRHIKRGLSKCNKSAKRTNKYRSYLLSIFKKLHEEEAVETNIIEPISVAKTGPKKKRSVLTPKQRALIDPYLKEAHYPFWRYMHIFFHSGGRNTELFQVKDTDVNLKNQTYRVTIKKGGQYVIVEKVIKDIVLHLWAEILSKCKSGDYLFSYEFESGSKHGNTDRVNKLWKKLVKGNPDLDNPEANFYDLKHLHSTEIVDMINNKAAADHNSHTTTKMVDTVYDVRAEERKNETVKTLMNAFS